MGTTSVAVLAPGARTAVQPTGPRDRPTSVLAGDRRLDCPGPTGRAGRVRGVSRSAGWRPHAEIIGEVAKSSPPASTAARCRSISSSVASPSATSRSRICSTVARSRTVHAGAGHREEGVGGHIDQPAVAEPGEGPPEGGVGPPLGQQGRNPRRSRLARTARARTRRCRSGAGAPGRRPRPAATPRAEHPTMAAMASPRRGTWTRTSGRGSGRRARRAAGRAPTSWTAGPRRAGRPAPPHPRQVDVGGQHRARPGPTRSAIQDATLGPPAPTSQQRQPVRDAESRGAGRSRGRTGWPGRRAARRPRPAGCRAGTLVPGRRARGRSGSAAAQESTRRRKLRSPSPRKSARKPVSTG